MGSSVIAVISLQIDRCQSHTELCQGLWENFRATLQRQNGIIVPEQSCVLPLDGKAGLENQRIGLEKQLSWELQQSGIAESTESKSSVYSEMLFIQTEIIEFTLDDLLSVLHPHKCSISYKLRSLPYLPHASLTMGLVCTTTHNCSVLLQCTYVAKSQASLNCEISRF